MSVVKTVTKIFGMFDKIDDIVYEPVKLICDAIRQPLDNAKDRHSQKLEMQLKQFEQDLEFERKEREMKLSIEERQLNEEMYPSNPPPSNKHPALAEANRRGHLCNIIHPKA